MFNLEGEFITASYRIPWLIWIQLLVLFLLILLFYSFTVLALDDFPRTPSDDSNNTVSSSSNAFFAFGKGTQKGKLPLYDNLNYGPSSSGNCSGLDGHGIPAQYASKVGRGQSIKGEIPNATQRVSVGTNINGRESSPRKDASFVSTGMEHHPCYIFRLARRAFLKCLGLDCIAEAPSNREQKKED